MPKKSKTDKYYYACGKRKTAVATVRLYEGGTGSLEVNKKDGKQFFPVALLLDVVYSPLKLLNLDNNFDIVVRVKGGGISAQAQAIRHGVARALVDFNNEYKLSLKQEWYLTRDPRRSERKKPGKIGARKSKQWSKR